MLGLPQLRDERSVLGGGLRVARRVVVDKGKRRRTPDDRWHHKDLTFRFSSDQSTNSAASRVW